MTQKVLDKDQKEITLPVSQKVVVLQEGDGYSDRLLLRRNKKAIEAIFDYMASLVVSIDQKTDIQASDLKQLFAPDNEFLMVEAYRLNYGDMFDFEFTCPSCDFSEARSVPLDKLEFKKLPSGIQGPDPLIEITLPKTKKPATIGMLTGEKEIMLMQQATTQGVDLNQTDRLSLRSLDGNTDPAYEDVVKLPLADHRAIRKARQKLICGIDTTVRVVCSACGAPTTFNMLLNKDFFLPAG
jgi:hypothetical protein